jgi:hypothetical protein
MRKFKVCDPVVMEQEQRHRQPMGERIHFSALKIIIHGSDLCQIVLSPISRPTSVENESGYCSESALGECGSKDEETVPTLAKHALMFPSIRGSLCLNSMVASKVTTTTNTSRHRFFQRYKRTHWEEIMDSVIAAEIARLKDMSVTSLAEKFETLIGEKCPPVGPLANLTGPAVKPTLIVSFLIQ